MSHTVTTKEPWDTSPEEISAAYQSKCALERTLRADIKDYKRIIYDLSGGKEKGMQAIEDWYDKEIAEEDRQALRDIENHIAKHDSDAFSKLGKIYNIATTALYFNKPD